MSPGNVRDSMLGCSISLMRASPTLATVAFAQAQQALKGSHFKLRALSLVLRRVPQASAVASQMTFETLTVVPKLIEGAA